MTASDLSTEEKLRKALADGWQWRKRAEAAEAKLASPVPAPPICDRCGTPTRNQPRATFILCSKCIPRIPVSESWLMRKLAIADDSECGAGSDDLDVIPAVAVPAPEDEIELREALAEFRLASARFATASPFDLDNAMDAVDTASRTIQVMFARLRSQ